MLEALGLIVVAQTGQGSCSGFDYPTAALASIITVVTVNVVGEPLRRGVNATIDWLVNLAKNVKQPH
jgi:hypothetical protein